MNIKNLRDKFIQKTVTETISNTEFLEAMKDNIRPVRETMTIYSCAMMEIETKLKVLDAEYSLDHDRNPIESIKTRLKSMDFWASLEHKAHYKKNMPSDIEKEIVEDLKNCAEKSAELDIQMEEIKKKIFLYE